MVTCTCVEEAQDLDHTSTHLTQKLVMFSFRSFFWTGLHSNQQDLLSSIKPNLKLLE